MKFLQAIVLQFSFFCLLPALAQAQTGASPKPKLPVSAGATVIGFNRDMSSVLCTTAPRSEWLTEVEMKLLAEHRGYRIKTFKLAKGDCYEIYGFDKDGHIIEAYFNPATSRLVRQNIAK
jgi:hypothetical protein